MYDLQKCFQLDIQLLTLRVFRHFTCSGLINGIVPTAYANQISTFINAPESL